jgi:hypothetical protein
VFTLKVAVHRVIKVLVGKYMIGNQPQNKWLQAECKRNLNLKFYFHHKSPEGTRNSVYVTIFIVDLVEYK